MQILHCADNTTRSQRFDRKHVALAGISSCISAIVSTLLWGFHYGISNNEFHAAIVYTIAKGLAFPGDAMVATLTNYASPFWWGIGYLSKVFPPFGVFLICFILARLLLNIGMGLTITAFSHQQHSFHPWVLASCLTVSSGFIQGLPLGADPVIGPFLSQTYVSIGLCMISFSMALCRHFIWSAVFLGIAYNVNAMQANFLFGILFIQQLLFCFTDVRKGLLSISRFLLITWGLASPTLIWIFSTISESANIEFSGKSLIDFAKFYYPDHYFWSSKSLNQKLQGVSLPLSLLYFSFAHRFFIKKSMCVPWKNTFIISSIILLFYTFLGVISLEYFPSRFFLQLHLFRSDVLCFTILVSFVSGSFLSLLYKMEYSSMQMLLLILVFILMHNFIMSFLCIIIYCIFSVDRNKIETNLCI